MKKPTTAVISAILLGLSASLTQAIEFKILTICKNRYDIPGYGSYSMSQSEINAARTAFTQTLPQMVSDHTNGQVTIDATFIVLSSMLRSNERVSSGNSNARPFVWPENMPVKDMQEYFGTFARGWYDHVFCYNAISEFQYVNSGWFTTDASLSWSCINRRSDLGYNEDALAGAWHEWTHGTETYYKSQGFDGGALHNIDFAFAPNSPFPYSANTDGLPNWMALYRDVLLGTAENGASGWGPAAWNQHGTPRSRYSDSPSSISSNGYYRIESRLSSRSVNVSQNSTAGNGTAKIIQWSYTGNHWNEQFKITAESGGGYSLRARHSNKALSTPAGNYNWGAQLTQYNYNGSSNQRWNINYRNSGNFSLRNRQSNLAMNVSGASANRGQRIIQWGYGTAINESFRLINIR